MLNYSVNENKNDIFKEVLLPPELWTMIFEYINLGDFNSMKFLISLAHVSHHFQSLVYQNIRSGVKSPKFSRLDFYPEHWAIFFEQPEEIAKHKSNSNTWYGLNNLHFSKMRIKKNESIMFDGGGHTLLEFAIYFHCLTAVKVMLKEYAINSQNIETGIRFAAQEGQPLIFEALMDHFKKDSEQFSALLIETLWIASYNGQALFVKHLIDNYSDQFNEEAYFCALALADEIQDNACKMKTIFQLLKCMNNPSLLLNYAVFFEEKHIILTTLNQGADINNKQTTPPLILAASKQLDLVKLLVRKGADPNIQNQNGNTALHVAAKANDLSIIKFLLRKGADKKIKNNAGQRYFELLDINSASEENKSKIALLKFQKNARGSTFFGSNKNEKSVTKKLINMYMNNEFLFLKKSDKKIIKKNPELKEIYNSLQKS